MLRAYLRNKKEEIPIPSSSKTLFLQLNKWLGSDKPKKDDFNEDNQKIDEACRLLSQSMEQLEASQSDVAASEAVTELTNKVNEHTGNGNIHVTQAEKDSWSTGGAEFIMGSYLGNDEFTRVIEIGFRPSFGIIFASGNGVVRATWSNNQLQLLSGYISSLGCSQGLSLTANGFSVLHQVATPDGFTCKFNTLNTTYVYFVMK